MLILTKTVLLFFNTHQSVVRWYSEQLAPLSPVRQTRRYLDLSSFPHAHVEQRQVKALQDLARGERVSRVVVGVFFSRGFSD